MPQHALDGGQANLMLIGQEAGYMVPDTMPGVIGDPGIKTGTAVLIENPSQSLIRDSCFRRVAKQ